MPDVVDSEPESPFRLSRPLEITDLEDNFGSPAALETQSPFKLSRLRELPEIDHSRKLSTLHECITNITGLDPADAELLDCVPSAIAEQYAARLCHVERLRRDAEQQTAELEASLGAIWRRDARKCCRVLCGVFLALAFVSTIVLLAKHSVLPQCSANVGDFAPASKSASALSGCAPNACSAQLKAVEDDVSKADRRRERDARGYMQALSGVDAWVTGSWEEGLFRSKVPNGGLARCVNETQATYRNLVADLNDALTWRQDVEAGMREQIRQSRWAHF